MVKTLKTALDNFETDNGRFPSMDEGLNALIEAPPNLANWHKLLDVDEIPKDPWGHEYRYQCPGQLNPQTYDLFSAGPDGEFSTDDDITSWKE